MSLKLSAIAVLFICLSSSAATAAAGVKRPWEWTLEERLAELRDPAKKRARVAEAQGRRGAALSAKAVDDVIDGGVTPELFLPTELFEHLIRTSISLPRSYPAVVAERSTDLFKAPGEWERFVAITAELTDLMRTELGAAAALDNGRVAALRTSKCAVSARALREARRVFGRERFDRMLYEAVAPGLSSVRGPEAREWRVEREVNCQ